MKYKTTAKAIRNYCYNVKCAGYCDLQYLLYYVSPTSYTCGVYGWNFDVYELDGLTITTGYRGMIGKRCEGIAEFENKAKSIINNWDMKTDEKKSLVMGLLSEFIELNKVV